MRPWSVRVVAGLAFVGLVASIALGSALPFVLALCLCGLLAAGQLHSRS